MGLQFRHQRGKLYRQVAMGEKHLLSITQGIALHHFVSNGNHFDLCFPRHEADCVQFSNQLFGCDLHLSVLQWLHSVYALLLFSCQLPSLAGKLK